MLSLLLLLHGVCLVYAETHSLRYFYTTVSGIRDFPEYTSVGLVDDQHITYFDSNTKRTVPKTDWIRENVGADYWDRETQIDIGTHQVFRNNIQVAMKRFNQTTGVHSVQMMHGCELDDDGTKRGYWQIGYDGEDFVSFDNNTLTWTAAISEAFSTKTKWDADNADNQHRKLYLENICIEWLQTYVRYGKDTLERKVSPQVSLLQKDPSSPVLCHATGFHPKEVTISWQKNTQDLDEDVDLGELLINEDGTFQKTSTLNVKPEERKKNKYECVVEHQRQTIRVILTEENYDSSAPFPIGIIVGVVAVVLLLVIIAVAGFMVYQKKKGFRPVDSYDNSNSSINSNQKP